MPQAARRERDPETEEVLRELRELAQTLAALGADGGADVDRRRDRLTHGAGEALLRHAAKLLAGDAPSRNRELAMALDAQADAIGKFARSRESAQVRRSRREEVPDVGDEPNPCPWRPRARSGGLEVVARFLDVALSHAVSRVEDAG